MVKKAKQKQATATIRDFSVLLGPVITEKASAVGTTQASGVVFQVAPEATKACIKAAVEKVFKVQVAKVRTCNYLGKVKRTGRSMGKRSNYKKAYITLRPGSEINLFEGV